ncbi:MAG: prepilin-type N-terminal cleavage/methylation domain-containing protein [Candidatus Paceibacterota bacterium]
MKLKSNLAFTLIELLVVIAIVGILSGFIIVSLSGATNAAKDAKVKSDIGALERALMVYGVQNNNTYPSTDTYPCTIGGGTTPCTNLATDLQPYIASLPTDPNGGYYTYSYEDGVFTLSAILSNEETYSYSSSDGFSTNSYTSTCESSTNAQVQCQKTDISATEEVCRCIYLSGAGQTTWTVPTGVNDITLLIVGGGGGGDYSAGLNGGCGGGGSFTGAYGNSIQTNSGTLTGYGNRGGRNGGYGGPGGGAGGISDERTVQAPGRSFSITGSAVTYAAGGYAAVQNTQNGTGNGGNSGPDPVYSYAGSSGVVIIRYTHP